MRHVLLVLFLILGSLGYAQSSLEFNLGGGHTFLNFSGGYDNTSTENLTVYLQYWDDQRAKISWGGEVAYHSLFSDYYKELGPNGIPISSIQAYDPFLAMVLLRIKPGKTVFFDLGTGGAIHLANASRVGISNLAPVFSLGVGLKVSLSKILYVPIRVRSLAILNPGKRVLPVSLSVGLGFRLGKGREVSKP
jgi:hypothetical protein